MNRITSASEIRDSYVENFKRVYNSIKLSSDGCKHWNRAKDRYGYGKVSVILKSGSRCTIGAHKFSYLIFVGDILPNQVVRHKNDVRDDINPENLLAGSQKDNMLDAKRRGRIDKSFIQAAKDKNRAFSKDDIELIRDSVEIGHSQREVARVFGCSYSTINCIVKRKSYSDI